MASCLQELSSDSWKGFKGCVMNVLYTLVINRSYCTHFSEKLSFSKELGENLLSKGRI